MDPLDQLISAIELTQHVTLDRADFACLDEAIAHHRQLSQRASYNVSLSSDPWICCYEIESGKIGSVLVAGGLGFATGGYAGAAIGILGALLQPSPPKKAKGGDGGRDEVRYGFDSGGSLGAAGSPLPLIYCNRQVDPAAGGGVRVGGFLIHSRVETLLGSNKLYALHALGAGESPTLGWGEIGFIDETRTLFNGQPRSNFDLEEIDSEARPGTLTQSPIAGFSVYSQNVSPPDYGVFGVDFRTEVKGAGTIATTPSTLNGVTSANGVITKTAITAAWDSGSFGGGLAAAGDELGVTVPALSNVAVGLSPADTGVAYSDIAYSWRFEASGIAYIEQYGAIAGSVPYVPGQLLEIAITQDAIPLVQWYSSGQLIYTSATSPALPLQPDTSFFDPGSSAAVAINGSTIGVTVLSSTTFSVGDDAKYDLLNISQDFIVCATGNSSVDPHFKVVSKNQEGRVITIAPATALADGARIFAWWEARYETTKRVHQVDLNLQFSLSGINSREKSKYFGQPRTHGSLFDLWARPVSSPIGSEVFLARFIAIGSKPQKLHRSIRIKDLKLGRYYFEMRPHCSDPGDAPLHRLTDTGVIQSISAANPLAGQVPVIEGEFYQWADASAVRDAMYYGPNKTQVSSESGPTGKVSSVNEIVYPDRDGVNPYTGIIGPERYPGIALYAGIYQASERLQQPPAEQKLVELGRIIPNHLAAGVSSALSSPTVLSVPSASFVAAGLAVGMTLRNLSASAESVIAAVTPTTITTATPLNWALGDRFVATFLGASPYYPDTFVDLLQNDFGGIRELVDPDEDIDYEYIVLSRAFCNQKKYYCNVVFTSQRPFQQVAADIAKESLLLPSRRNGRYGLRPERMEPVSDVFNSTEINNFRESWTEWQGQTMNRLVVTYTDGRDLFEKDGARHREKTITIETPGAFLGTDFVREEQLSLTSVTYPKQAIEVGCCYLKSSRLQDRTVSFNVGLHAMYREPGDLMRVQHPSGDVREEYSGYVVEAGGLGGGQQIVRLNCQPIILEGVTSQASANGVIDARQDFLGTAAIVGDLLINASCPETRGVITAVTATGLQAGVVFGEGDRYRVLNLTAPADLFASVKFRETGAAQENLPFSFVPGSGGDIELAISGLSQPLRPGDSVNVGGAEHLYRIQSCEPVDKISFAVLGLFHPGERLYSTNDLVISYDDVILNKPN